MCVLAYKIRKSVQRNRQQLVSAVNSFTDQSKLEDIKTLSERRNFFPFAVCFSAVTIRGRHLFLREAGG